MLDSGELIIKNQEDKFNDLSKKFDEMDFKAADIRDINSLSKEITLERDEMTIYKDMHDVFTNIFDNNSEGESKYLNRSLILSDKAKKLVKKYDSLSERLIYEKFSGRYDIVDSGKPEKEMSYIQRNIRSLSQASTKAGLYLWKLEEYMDHVGQFMWQDLRHELEEIEDKIKKTSTLDKAHQLLLQKNEKGEWTGNFIQQYSKDFFIQARKAIKDRDSKWVKDNIDLAAYEKWYNQALDEYKKEIEPKKWHIEDKQNKEMHDKAIEAFTNKYSIKNGVNPENYKIQNFPKEGKWESKEYREISSSGNEAIRELWDWWRKILDRSEKSGMIENNMGYSYLPRVPKQSIEKLLSGGSFDMLSDLTLPGVREDLKILIH